MRSTYIQAAGSEILNNFPFFNERLYIALGIRQHFHRRFPSEEKRVVFPQKRLGFL